MANPIVVLKIGSSSLAAADGQHPNLSAMCALVECICKLRRRGYRVVLVSSGAVAFGCQRMRLAAKPADLCTKQAVAAIGQGRLMKMYDDFFSALDQPVAQVHWLCLFCCCLIDGLMGWHTTAGAADARKPVGGASLPQRTKHVYSLAGDGRGADCQ
jgi:hypothetical protein